MGGVPKTRRLKNGSHLPLAVRRERFGWPFRWGIWQAAVTRLVINQIPVPFGEESLTKSPLAKEESDVVRETLSLSPF
jgi:hypothetical protein